MDKGETVSCWRPATITPHQQGGALITEQTVPIWVSFNLSSPLSLLKNLVVPALYQYSRPSPLSEADNIANPRKLPEKETINGKLVPSSVPNLGQCCPDVA
ncbi:hypothetical protein J6590_080009 [Homalodisca vitripennis]|nr:hypothetical protein J6590_080009 [Homalodisca vitripennis]